tara:strand:- start:256 stop:528 length:273 start_codon:yes stop_codon:yes gene_type:complete
VFEFQEEEDLFLPASLFLVLPSWFFTPFFRFLAGEKRHSKESSQKRPLDEDGTVVAPLSKYCSTASSSRSSPREEEETRRTARAVTHETE